MSQLWKKEQSLTPFEVMKIHELKVMWSVDKLSRKFGVSEELVRAIIGDSKRVPKPLNTMLTYI